MAPRRPTRARASPAPAPPDLSTLTFRKVDGATWPDLERLFEGRGGPSYCWCMAWRAMPPGRRTAGNAHRKRCLKERVDAAIPVGILGYLGGEPVAWCSIAPRETYRPLGGADVPGDAPGAVWSLACLYVVRRLRGLGMADRMVEAAVAHARAQGAAVVEAYPVDPDSPSYGFMGFVPVFKRQGFRHVGRAGIRRHVVRLELR